MRFDHKGVVHGKGCKNAKPCLPCSIIHDLVHHVANSLATVIFVNQAPHEAFLVDSCADKKIAYQLFSLKSAHHEKGFVGHLPDKRFFAETVRLEIGLQSRLQGI